MDEAQTLFRQGVVALRERDDRAAARRLLTRSLKLQPRNADGWLWLSRTVETPTERLRCVEQALKVRPDHPQARALHAKLTTRADPRQIEALLTDAAIAKDAEDIEEALRAWLTVLKLQPGHTEALREAVGMLARNGHLDDAFVVVNRSIEQGARHPSIYLTAIDLADRLGEYAEADALREQLVSAADVDEPVIVGVADHFMRREEWLRAEDVLAPGLERFPNSQPLLRRMGDVMHNQLREAEAMIYYDRAASLDATSREGREADKRLGNFVPILTDRERGSVLLALREAAGIAVLFALLGWLDAGLDLLQLGPLRWLGVGLAFIGGYVVVTATSSPQQVPLARWLGGIDPPTASADQSETDTPQTEQSVLPILPETARIILGTVGGVLLVVAFALVFSQALQLLGSPITPTDIPDVADLIR